MEQGIQTNGLIFVDRTALACFMDIHHPFHRQAVSFFYNLDDLERPMVTLNLLIYELHEWLSDLAGYDQAQYFLNAVQKAEQSQILSVIQVDADIENEALQLMLEKPNLELSFLQACSFIVMDQLGVNRMFSFDNHLARVCGHVTEIDVVPSR